MAVIRKPQTLIAVSSMFGLAAVGAVYAASRVTLPSVPCTVPTAAFQHTWNSAASHVHSDVSAAEYLAAIGGFVAVLGIVVGRPRDWAFRFLVPYCFILVLVIVYGDGITTKGCGI